MKKLAEQIRRIGLIANTDKVSCRPVLEQAAQCIRESGRQVFTESATGAFLATKDAPLSSNAAALAREVDLLLVFGGDGTMLRVARDVAGCRTPILGINVGSLGFLTAVPSGELSVALGKVWAGDFSIEARPLIEAAGQTKETKLALCALNDFVISRGAASRMIELLVSVDGEVLTRYKCDGLVVSSPTGSTAYSLSAGGAIVSPAAEVFTLTPICPHTLSNRSVIVSLSSRLEVRVLNVKPETILSADGQVETRLSAGDTVTINRSRRVLRLIRLSGSSFFGTLRQKLHWSGSNV